MRKLKINKKKIYSDNILWEKIIKKPFKSLYWGPNHYYGINVFFLLIWQEKNMKIQVVLMRLRLTYTKKKPD